VTVPCAKGTLLKGVVVEAKARLESGDLTQADLDRILKPEDLKHFEDEPLISNWYPIDTYARVCELLVVGDRLPRREALLELGRRSAQRIVQLGLYSQVDARTEGRWEDRVGRVLVSLFPVFFNFSKWEWIPPSDAKLAQFTIVIREAEAMPETVRLRMQGFVEYLATRACGAPVTLTADFPDRGTIVLKGRRPV
jgi:hypothetical protein